MKQMLSTSIACSGKFEKKLQFNNTSLIQSTVLLNSGPKNSIYMAFLVFL